MKKCKLCENLVDENDWEVCESCRDKAKNYDTARDMGSFWQENVEVNGFWAHCFSKEEIDDILYASFNKMPKEKQEELINNYCEDDMLYFVRWLKQKWKEK